MVATSYPSGLDNFTNPAATDAMNSLSVPHADQHANLNDAVEAIEAELGTKPSGVYSSVAARLAAISTAGTASISVSGGVATAPSVVFTGDPDTGIWSPGANTWAVSTGGSEALRITSAGNVGIGTSSPTVGLELGGAVGGPSQIRLKPASNTVDLRLNPNYGSADLPSLSVVSNHPLAFHTNNTERMRIDSSGKVYIGLTAGVIGTNGNSANLQVTAAGGVPPVSLQRYSANAFGTDLDFMKSRNATPGSHTVVQTSDYLGSLYFSGSDGTNFQPASAIRAYVDSGTISSTSMPGAVSLWTTPNGSTTLTERMKIDNAGLITGSGTSLGAWTAYTPTLGGTGWAIGNGTATGRYCQIGKIVHFVARIVLGSTSTAGGSIATVGLPLTSTSTAPSTRNAFLARSTDVSVGTWYALHAFQNDSTTSVAVAYQSATSGALTGITTNAPYTWATGDTIEITGTYEAA